MRQKMFSFHWERSQLLILPKTQFPPSSYFPNARTGEHTNASQASLGSTFQLFSLLLELQLCLLFLYFQF